MEKLSILLQKNFTIAKIIKLYLLIFIFIISVSMEVSFSKEKFQSNFEIKKYKEKLQSTNSALRILVMKKLIKINNKKTLKPLIFALNDPLFYIRIMSIRKLVELDYKNAVIPLMKRLKYEKKNYIKKEIILALGNLGSEKARFLLIKLSKNPNLLIRSSVKKALKMLNIKNK